MHYFLATLTSYAAFTFQQHELAKTFHTLTIAGHLTHAHTHLPVCNVLWP